jgi:hypothetical protein
MMSFFAGLLAYLVGLSVPISIGIIGLLTLQFPNDRTTPVALSASKNRRLRKPSSVRIDHSKEDAQPNRKNKAVHAAP